MSWIIITITAQLFFAVASTIDKHIVSNTKLKPIAYAFYSGILQILFLALIPIVGFSVPDAKYSLIGIFDGALFIWALVVFYKALKLGEASRIVPTIGISVPVFTIPLAYIILNESLSDKQFFSFIFFVLGGILLSVKFTKGKIAMIRGTMLAILAGFLFALYYALMKYLYLPKSITFFDGLVLIQIGGFLGALSLLVIGKNREIIFNAPKTIQKKTTGLFIPNKILAALAAVLLSYAISINGSVIAIINALQAVQYVFILLLAIALSKKLPNFYNEQVGGNIIIQKIIAIVFVGVGLFLLTV